MTRRDYLLLLLAVGIIAGYAYGLDTPQALEAPLREEPYNWTSTDFNLIYFATFSLIAFLVIPIGIVMDKYPIKLTLMLLLLVLLLSQAAISLLFTFTPPYYLPIIYIMRSLFGLAGEGLYTAQCIIMSIYAENEYEFLAGLALALPFGFDALNSVTTTAVYHETNNLPLCWWIGVGVCIGSFISGIWLNKSIISKGTKANSEEITVHIQYSPKAVPMKIKALEEVKPQGFFEGLKNLNNRFWVISFFILFTEASLGPFNDNLNELIIKRFSFEYTEAGKLLLIPFTALIIFTIIFSAMLKKRPSLRRVSMLVSTSTYLFAHFLLYFTPNSTEPQGYHYVVVIFFLFAMAFNFSIYYTCITPCVPFLVSTDVLGTAWGIAGSAIGLSQCLIPILFIIVIGGRSNLSNAYSDLCGIGVILAIIPLGFAMWINYFDYDILDMKYSESDLDAESEKKKESLAETHSESSDDSKSLEENLIVEETAESS